MSDAALQAYFVVVAPDGGIAWSGSCPAADLDAQPIPSGHSIEPVLAAPLNPDDHRWSNGTLVPYIPPPPTIGQLRAACWLTAKVARDGVINGGCATSFGRVDSDETSRNYMLGARALAQDAVAAGSTDAVGWKMADNSIVPLTPEQLIAMTRDVGLFVAACQANAQAIGVAIEAATSAGALAAIDITAGYPTA